MFALLLIVHSVLRYLLVLFEDLIAIDMCWLEVTAAPSIFQTNLAKVAVRWLKMLAYPADL